MSQISASARKERVRRHTIRQTGLDTGSPIQLGNGRFAMTLDVTGLQTLESHYHDDFALSTMMPDIWHCSPGMTPGEAFRAHPRDELRVGNRRVHYLHPYGEDCRTTGDILRSAMHRLNLATIGLWGDGEVMPEQINSIDQTLDLWTGKAVSRFRWRGRAICVESVIGSDCNTAAFRIKGLERAGRIRLRFSYPDAQFGSNGARWDRPALHSSVVMPVPGGCIVRRTVNQCRYVVSLQVKGGEWCVAEEHAIDLAGGNDDALEIVLRFSIDDISEHMPSMESVTKSAEQFWEQFWLSGGCCDFSGSTDDRAYELERRVVLSEYLTRINCVGLMPPAETGLACNSWFGRFHLEMHWFHAVHFLLWDRPEFLEESMPFYLNMLPFCRAYAQEQGYRGARLPKSLAPYGLPTAGLIETYLLWQQPHPIYYAELFYRSAPEKALMQYGGLVEELADFIADFFEYDTIDGLFHLGPPMIDAAELYLDPMKNRDPNFETSYLLWALTTAQKWRERSQRARSERYDRILASAPTPVTVDGRYVAGASARDTFGGGRNWSHPMMIAPAVFAPGERWDLDIMRNTVRKVCSHWDWHRACWGWDYPLTAIVCGMCGDAGLAVDSLLRDGRGNDYRINGHNRQGFDMLPCYLPGNGSLLTAVAHLAATGVFNALPDWDCTFEGLRTLL